jgi:hypothetical protein
MQEFNKINDIVVDEIIRLEDLSGNLIVPDK